MRGRKNVILADCIPEEIEDFRKGLEASTGLEWEVMSKVSNWGRTSKWSDFRRYLTYFLVPFIVFINRKQYHQIVGWQQFYSLIFCFFCRVFHVSKTFDVIAVNFTYKEKNGLKGKLYYRFMRYMVNSKYLDHIMVLSKEYIDFCSDELEADKTKFHALCFGVPDLYEKYCTIKPMNTALAIGRSNRDYNWLLQEWRTIDYPLIIISDTYSPPKDLPLNVTIIDNISGDEQYPYIMKSRIVILPIDDPSICSGDTVLLTAMSFKKTVIVTSPSTLAEMYILDGNNGYCVSKQKGLLAKCMKNIIEENKYLGESARESYLNNYSRYSMGEACGSMISSYRENSKGIVYGKSGS